MTSTVPVQPLLANRCALCVSKSAGFTGTKFQVFELERLATFVLWTRDQVAPEQSEAAHSVSFPRDERRLLLAALRQSTARMRKYFENKLFFVRLRLGEHERRECARPSYAFRKPSERRGMWISSSVLLCCSFSPFASSIGRREAHRSALMIT